MKAVPTFSILYNIHYEHLLPQAIKGLGLDLCLSEHFYFESLQRYYSKEMGNPLLKVYAYAKELFEDIDILDLKLKTMEIEKYFSTNSNRTINIDPGYINKQHLILASSKERGARIHIGQNIFLEMEYIYIYQDFKPFYWTYGDYRDKKVKEFFIQARAYFLKLL